MESLYTIKKHYSPPHVPKFVLIYLTYKLMIY